MVIEQLTSLGYGIIALGVMIGIGIVVLVTLGANVASTSPTANTTLNTISTYLGTGSGGLATWIPIIIVMVIGLWFLGYFMVRKGQKA